ncbi:hypothetical protein KO506_05610 [Polaribacter vadi]|uniref:hypothetical protein n=1 Tax=Polaribacter TaxID=52959 RepID=UPI001C08A803|nr:MULTISPECIES: hypothetical protein [Polaribacter]MBU3010868.1 hypothetical protein [Polaribacter vadi]MDO6740680.1 hypothetical protein [Polaribacter sp. 1_MG-2023]
MKFKILILLIFVLLIKSNVSAQDANNKWAIGVGAAGLLYSEEDGSSVGFRYSDQFPRFTLATYAFTNITLSAAISTSRNEGIQYTTFDGDIRYDFGTSENTLSIYALLGGSLVDTKDYLAPFINVGGGGTLWLSDRFGLNGQAMYKINYYGLQSQGSHIYVGGAIVYRFSLSGGGGSSSSRSRIKRDTGRKRIWEMKH